MILKENKYETEKIKKNRVIDIGLFMRQACHLFPDFVVNFELCNADDDRLPKQRQEPNYVFFYVFYF